MSDVGPRVSWGISRRLEFLEFRLVWEGRVNRSDLVEVFGISPQQASADLARYQDAAPGNISYDSSAKTMRPSDGFAPKFLRPYADRYLLQLAAIENGWIDREDTWFGSLPSVGVVPTPRRRVNAELVRRVLDAIRRRRTLEVCYKSMSGPERKRRVIAPHAFGFNGSRWHVRAWSAERGDFRDFVLTRLSEAQDVGASDVDPSFDYEWHDEVDVVLEPHPELDAGKRAALADEYDMEHDRLVIPTRVSLAFYMVQTLFLDLPLDVAPERRQLVLANGPEIQAARERARDATRHALEDTTHRL